MLNRVCTREGTTIGKIDVRDRTRPNTSLKCDGVGLSFVGSAIEREKMEKRRALKPASNQRPKMCCAKSIHPIGSRLAASSKQ